MKPRGWPKSKRLPEAVCKATREEAVERFRTAVDAQERRIAEAFTTAVERLRDVATIERVTEALESGGAAAAVDVLRPEVTANALQPLEAAIGAAVVAGAQTAAAVQPPVTGRNGVAVDFVANATNPRLQDFAERVTATRIREVSEDVRAVTRRVIADGTAAGDNPLTIARRVRESIGLTARQEQAVRNFRRALEEGNAAALSRELRDRRFDPTVRRAIAGEPIGEEKLERMVGRYRERFIKHRSEVIGRTEATRAVAGANQELMRSYVDRDLIDERQVRRFWHFTRDDRTRAEHRLIPGLNPNGRGLREPFETPLGPLMFPGDPSGVAENTVQCVLPDVEIEARNLRAATRHWYEGTVVRVELAGGEQLAVTPNHPILSSGGWVPASKLQQGDDLVRAGFGEKGVALGGALDVDHVQAPAQEIFDALGGAGRGVRVPRVDVNFHGDRPDQDVDVVLADRGLGRARPAVGVERLYDLWFPRADLAQAPCLRDCGFPASSLKRFCAATARRFMGFRHLVSPLGLGHRSPLQSLRFAAASQRDTALLQVAQHGGATFDAAGPSDLVGRVTSQVHALGMRVQHLLPPFLQARQAGELELAQQRGGAANSPFSGQVGESLASKVALVQIVNVHEEHYSGYVYNFETAEGWYSGNGIVHHNCRCVAFQRVVSMELIEEP